MAIFDFSLANYRAGGLQRMATLPGILYPLPLMFYFSEIIVKINSKM